MPLAIAASASSRPRRLLVVSSLAAVTLFGLVACAPSPTPTPSSTASSSSTKTATPSETPSATAQPTAQPGTPITLSCDELLTADDIYAFNPNVGTDPNFSASEGSLAGAAVADNGIACGFSHQSSGELLSFALSQPSPENLTSVLNAAVSSSKPVPTYGAPPEVNGFFTVVDGVGEVQIITPKYWLTATSTMFFEPGDVGGLVDAALAHLPQ